MRLGRSDRSAAEQLLVRLELMPEDNSAYGPTPFQDPEVTALPDDVEPGVSGRSGRPSFP